MKNNEIKNNFLNVMHINIFTLVLEWNQLTTFSRSKNFFTGFRIALLISDNSQLIHI